MTTTLNLVCDEASSLSVSSENTTLRTERGFEYSEQSAIESQPYPHPHYCFNLQILKMDGRNIVQKL